MTRKILLSGAVAVAVMSSLVSVALAAGVVNYAGQTATAVAVNYSGVPANTQLVFVNNTSGAKTVSDAPIVSGSGSATLTSSALANGAYYVRAQDATTGARTAQTVVFYICNSSCGGDGL